MPAILGSGDHRYRVVENFAKLPDGWSLTDVASVAVDSKDRLYVFNRGAHPMVVLDRDGNFLRSWGEGLFNRAHGLHIDADDNLYCTDDGDHTVRKCSTDGKVLMTIGIPNKPAPFMSGEPFHRCTHTALSPKGEIYVSDGYGNACVHKYSPDGKLLKTWGEPGTDPGQFNIVHNIATDDDGWVYVADRENHRVQVFDGNGKYETQWNNLHRPCALCRCGGKQPTFIIGELGPGMAVNRKVAQSRPAALDRRRQGQPHRAARRRERPRHRGRQIPRAARHRDRFQGRHLSRRSRRHRLEDQLSGHADAAGSRHHALPAEAGEDSKSPTASRAALFGFFRIAPHRVGFGEDADRAAFAAGFDHDQRFGFGGVEHRDRFLDVHGRMQHHLAVMQDVDQALALVDIGRVRFRDQRQPDVMAGAVDRDHLRLRAQRKFLPELLDLHVRHRPW